jgi:predicted ATPase
MLVGREWELDTITAAMTAARRGAQREVHLVGEPRIGKTALAKHAAVMASGQAQRWCTTPPGRLTRGK